MSWPRTPRNEAVATSARSCALRRARFGAEVALRSWHVCLPVARFLLAPSSSCALRRADLSSRDHLAQQRKYEACFFAFVNVYHV